MGWEWSSAMLLVQNGALCNNLGAEAQCTFPKPLSQSPLCMYLQRDSHSCKYWNSVLYVLKSSAVEYQSIPLIASQSTLEQCSMNTSVDTQLTWCHSIQLSQLTLGYWPTVKRLLIEFQLRHWSSVNPLSAAYRSRCWSSVDWDVHMIINSSTNIP